MINYVFGDGTMPKLVGQPALYQVLVSPLLGGAGIVAVNLAVAARRRSIPCTALIPGAGPASAAVEAAGIPWRDYNLQAIRRSTSRQLRVCWHLFRVVRGSSASIVHVHNPTVYRLIYPALRLAGVKTVVHFQIEPSIDEIRWAMRYPPDHVIACARYIAAKVTSELGFASRKPAVTVVPNAIDTTRFAPGSQVAARRRLGLQSDRFVILVMANLAPHKGQVTVLRAVHHLMERSIPIECWLAGEDRGDGKYEQSLLELARSLGIVDRVRFLGFRTDGPELLRAADALLLPSGHEGLPLAVLEAQAAGVPVVASTIPGIKEIVDDGRTGLTVPAGDSKGYADAVERLYGDATLRHSLVRQASAQVQREYSWTSFEDRIFAVYKLLSPALLEDVKSNFT